MVTGDASPVLRPTPLLDRIDEDFAAAPAAELPAEISCNGRTAPVRCFTVTSCTLQTTGTLSLSSPSCAIRQRAPATLVSGHRNPSPCPCDVELSQRTSSSPPAQRTTSAPGLGGRSFTYTTSGARQSFPASCAPARPGLAAVDRRTTFRHAFAASPSCPIPPARPPRCLLNWTLPIDRLSKVI